MNALVDFKLCTLSDMDLAVKVNELTDNMYQEQQIPTRHIPARPDKDYDLLVGELIRRFLERTWIAPKDQTPQLIENEDYSENVLAICNGKLAVMCYCYVSGEDGGYFWANCNGQIDGHGEFDDDYDVVLWMPFLSIPNDLTK